MNNEWGDMMDSVMHVEDLTVAYDKQPVLWDVDLSIPRGILLGIVGPNGAGKTTLVKAALNLVKPLTGEVDFSDKPYRKVHKSIAYVPQKGSVDWDFPTTVFDVVLMGRYGHIGWVKRPSKKDRTLAIEALKQVDMLGFKNRQISELSGGQQQRVFLARALVQDADLYFMDEPFQGVDVKTERAIVKLLKSLKARRKTVVVVHHDLNTVSQYFDWVTLLNIKVIAHGPTDQVFTESNIRKTYQADTLMSIERDFDV